MDTSCPRNFWVGADCNKWLAEASAAAQPCVALKGAITTKPCRCTVPHRPLFGRHDLQDTIAWLDHTWVHACRRAQYSTQSTQSGAATTVKMFSWQHLMSLQHCPKTAHACHCSYPECSARPTSQLVEACHCSNHCRPPSGAANVV